MSRLDARANCGIGVVLAPAGAASGAPTAEVLIATGEKEPSLSSLFRQEDVHSHYG